MEPEKTEKVDRLGFALSGLRVTAPVKQGCGTP